MKIERKVLGPLNNNTYILSIKNEALIIDPTSEEEITEYLKNNNLKLIGILVTHYHFDHIGALEYFREKYKVKVYDYKCINSFNLGEFSFDIIKTPGHSKDSVSFYFPKSDDLFVGDFIFKNSIGRCDLEGGSVVEMKESLEKLKKFKEETKIYPGHGSLTTLKEELRSNPYLC